MTRSEIVEAAERIAPFVRRTPVIAVDVEGSPVTLKLELFQHTGSFKPRGAFNRILAADVPEGGVIAASGGNHGLAVAYAAKTLGIRAQVFVPEVTPPVKVKRLRDYGAEVVVTGEFYADALEASAEQATRTGALVVHAYDQPEVVAGQGTVGRELMEQISDVDVVLVAVGGAGLIGGVAGWFSGRARVIGVEPSEAPTLSRALEAGRPVDVEVGGIAADSLGAARVGDIAFDISRQYVDDVVLVSDPEIRRAQQWLWSDVHLISEPGGAAALAAYLEGRYRGEPGERVAVVVCGANTDPAGFA